MEQNIPHSRKIKMILIVIILFISAWPKGYAQNTGGLKIIVRDSTSKELIPFASIRVFGTRIGTGTSTGGFYLLNKIPEGKQILEINSVGYNQFKKEINIRKDTFQLFTILLAPSPVLMNTVTKVTDRLREYDETNISVRQISQTELKIIPLTIEKDFIRAIKVLPGISTSSDITSQFFVRGGAGDQNLILFDNMIIYNPFHTMGLFSIFNSDAVRSAEIMTGGFSPEYGGRLSSVLSITSKDGNKNKSSLKANMGTLTVNGIYEGPIPNGSLFLAYRRSMFNNILQKFMNKDVPLKFFDFSGKATFDISEAGKLSINFLQTGDDIENYSLLEQKYSTSSYAFGTSLQSFLNNIILTTTFGYSKYKSGMSSIANNKSADSKNEISCFSFNTKFDMLFSKNDLFSVGANLNNQNFNYTFLNSYGFKIAKDDPLAEINLFAKYRLTQIENLSLEMGVRTNINFMNKVKNTNIEPRFSLKFNLCDKFSLKSSYTRMSQVIISSTNEDDVISLFEVLLPIGNEFKPERADQYVLGFETILSENFSLNIQGYFKNIYNYLGYNIERKSKTDPDFIAGSGKAKGIETYIKYDGNLMYGWLTYNYSQTEKTLKNFTFAPRFDKRHNLNIIIGLKLPYDFSVSAHWEFSSGMPFTPIAGYYDQTVYPGVPYDTTYSAVIKKAVYGQKNSKRLPAYHKLDLSFSKIVEIKDNLKLNLSIDLNNVYDQKNIFYYDKTNNERINMLPFLFTFSIGVEL